MVGRSSGVILRQIHSLLTAGTFSGQTDQQLLERFLARRDEVSELAFTVLVERHGPMVLGVCRRILVDPHDAEDAFQATFLLLVRKAGSIRVDGSVGRWLFGVATRVASRAKADARRRLARERSGLDRLEILADETATTAVNRAELQSILAEELGKLPARLQAAVLLCDLEGSSHEEAARRLGWPVGTVKSRLSRARACLRERLTRRGLAPPDLSIAMPLLSAALPRSLVEATTRAAQSLIAGRVATTGIVSASVTTLTEGVLQTMFWTKLKLAAVAVLVMMTGSAVVFSQATAQKPLARSETIANPAAPAKGTDEAASRDDELDVVMLERAWADAIPRRDAAVVNRILAEDFEGIDPVGNIFTKATYMPDLRNGVFTDKPIELDEIKTRLFGETAVVTSRIKISGYPTGGRMTNVYVKRRGRWQCVASHASGMAGGNCPALGAAVGALDLKVSRAGIPLTQPAGQVNNCIKCHAVSHQRSATDSTSASERFFAKPGAAGPRQSDQITQVRPRFECLVEKVYVKLGQIVKQGDPLADLFSTDLVAAKIDYKTARNESEREQIRLRWSQEMFAKGYQSEGQLTIVRNTEERSRLRVQLAADKLHILGLDDQAIRHVAEEGEGERARLTIRSPVAGTIIEIGAQPGNRYDTNDVLMAIHPTSFEKPAVP